MYALSQANERHHSEDDYAASSSPQMIVSNQDPQVDVENKAHSATKKSDTQHHSRERRKKSEKKKKHHRDRHHSHRNEAHGHTASENVNEGQLLVSQIGPGDGNRAPSGSPDKGNFAAAATASNRTKQPFDRNNYEDIAVERVEYVEKSTGPTVGCGNEMRDLTKPGAIAVDAISAIRRRGIMDEENPYISTVSDDTTQEYTRFEASRITGETFEARCVSDNEVVQDHAAEIAAMVRRQLMADATVPVEVQPSSHQQMTYTNDNGNQRKKRVCLVSIGLLAIVAAIALGVGLAVSKQNSTPPTTIQTEREKSFQVILEQVSGDSLMDDTSPQYQAMKWLANTDPANLSASVDSEDTIKMRYVAAVLYYSFHGDDWHKKYNFLSQHDICTWNQNSVDGLEPFGISCGSGDMVESFRTPANNLKGKIPPEITFLSNLKIIDVLNNTIEGTLSNLESLSRLERLDMSENAFTGTLPEFLLTHGELSSLYLENNRLEGTISHSAGTAPNLKNFWLRDNLMTGQIPATIGQSTVLQSIDLQSNRLSGKIPEFASRSTIVHLLVGNNNLTGTIPTTIGSLSALQILALYGNDFTGTFPTELGKCRRIIIVDAYENSLTGNIGPVIDVLPPSIQSLDASGNQLGGIIPASVGTLTKLDFIDLQDNNVGGMLPSEIGLLNELVVLNLAYNTFTGSVPSTLATLPKLADLRLQGNTLDGSVDSLCSIDFEFFAANTCSDPDEIECACCTHCCDAGATHCEFVV